jgi:hypothetical protein
MNVKRVLLTALVFAAVALNAFALPTVDEVQAEIGRGNFAHAETMMQEVVASKPGSARAHYVYGEILAHNKRFDEAAKQVARAKAIDPAIGFADPAKFRSFEQLLDRELRQAKPAAALTTPVVPADRAQAQAESSASTPSWIWILGLAGVGLVGWILLSRRRQAASPSTGLMGAAPNGAVATSPVGYGAGPGYGVSPGPGPGMLGVGLAAAGGVAAGMMAARLLDGQHASSSAAVSGGLVPGMFDDEPSTSGAAQELEQRDVDFGVGDGWGGGDGGSDPGSDGW